MFQSLQEDRENERARERDKNRGRERERKCTVLLFWGASDELLGVIFMQSDNPSWPNATDVSRDHLKPANKCNEVFYRPFI